MPTRCFVSYCHDDVDRVTLDYVRFLLKEHSEERYELLIDEDLHYGADLTAFMDLLNEVDAVILILSPAYKRKIEERKGGVYSEYSKIYRRYSELQEERKAGKKPGEILGFFDLIPIVMAGDINSAVPTEIAHLKFLPLSGLRVSRDDRNEFLITDHIRKTYLPEIRRLTDRLRFIVSITSRDFRELYEEYYQRLFVENKADWTNPKHVYNNYVHTLFVKTFSYKKIENEAVYFIIGRKGSGKSTVTGVLHQRQRDRFIGHIAINADDFDLEGPYALFHFDQVESDTTVVVSRQRCFEFAWEAFIHVCSFEILANAAMAGGLRAYQNERIGPLADVLTKVAPKRSDLSESERMRAYFTHTFSSATTFAELCIDEAREDPKYFYSDIQARFTRLAYLRYLFGDDAITALDDVLASMRRKFLLTLDGFDTKFDMFRRRSIVEYHDQLYSRASFEIDWLRSLLLLVLNMKQAPAVRLHELVQVCITVPKDRFQEIQMTERDSYRYQNRYCSLNWTGIELAILLRKRLEELTQSSSDKGKTPEERLAFVMKGKFPHIPLEIQFDYNARPYSMPVFLYVLRHTFWRPRDILLYYAKILAASEELRRKKVKMSTDAVRRAVKEATFDVIQSEFINEFSSSLINIREVIGCFAKVQQFIPHAAIGDIIGGIDFEFAVGPEVVKKLDEKIEYLFSIGFLGVQVSDELKERFDIQHRHAFYFNEGSSLLRTLVERRFENFTFIVHPVFTEYLEIDTTARELVLELSWEYLHEMEAVLSASNG